MRGVVAIVGRPNVGKSSLFNRIVGERLSITDDASGITRDRIYSKASWLNQDFRVIDTGGIILKDEPFLKKSGHKPNWQLMKLMSSSWLSMLAVV